jgi:hypothetical protein
LNASKLERDHFGHAPGVILGHEVHFNIIERASPHNRRRCIVGGQVCASLFISDTSDSASSDLPLCAHETPVVEAPATLDMTIELRVRISLTAAGLSSKGEGLDYTGRRPKCRMSEWRIPDGRDSSLMASKTLSLCLTYLLATTGLSAQVVFAAPIEEVLNSLKGLPAKERLARVESEARKEGIVRWASSTPQAWAEPSLQAFRKRYPGIQIEYMRQSGRVLAERIVREHRAGKHDIDIVGTSAVTFAGIKDAGVIVPYVSPEAAQLRKEMNDPEGWWVAYFGNIQAIICNRNRG